MATRAVLLLLASSFALALAAKIPDYVKLCKRDVPDFDGCLTNMIESMRPHLAKGIPRMKIPGLEPLTIPALQINRNNDALQMKAKMKDITAYGGTGFVINRLKTNMDKLAMDMTITIPNLKVSADYDMEGRILVLPLNGKGVFKGNFTNTKAEVRATGKLIKNKKGVQFVQVKDMDVKLTSNDPQVKLISKGNQNNDALTQTGMNFYKQNRQQVLQIVMPIVEETTEAFIRQFANNILRAVPYSELVPN